MTDDKLDFLDEAEGEELQVEVEEPQAEVEAVETEAPQESVVEVEPETGAKETEVPPTPEVPEEPKAIPVTALLDEREKRQAAERKAEESAAKIARLEQQMRASQEPQKRPDFFENPDAAMQQQMTSMKLQQSKFLAEREFGADVVAEAYAYYDQNPQESAALLEHPSPFHAAVEAYKRQKFLSEVGSDPEAWKAAQLEELKQQIASQQPVQPKAPPPTMAKTPNAGGVAVASGSAFDEVFS